MLDTMRGDSHEEECFMPELFEPLISISLDLNHCIVDLGAVRVFEHNDLVGVNSEALLKSLFGHCSILVNLRQVRVIVG